MDMRSAIDATKILLEAPGLISGTEDFGMNDPARNLQRARLLAQGSNQVLHDDNSCQIIMSGTTDGAVGLISKLDGKLYYYVKFESIKLPLTGRTVTQVELWRNRAVGRYFPRITEHVFFNILLPHFGAVMSDDLQTQDGAHFWERVLSEATAKGLRVSFVDFSTGTVVDFDPSVHGSLALWLASNNPWGFGRTFQKRRLMISQ